MAGIISTFQLDSDTWNNNKKETGFDWYYWNLNYLMLDWMQVWNISCCSKHNRQIHYWMIIKLRLKETNTNSPPKYIEYDGSKCGRLGPVLLLIWTHTNVVLPSSTIFYKHHHPHTRTLEIYVWLHYQQEASWV